MNKNIYTNCADCLLQTKRLKIACDYKRKFNAHIVSQKIYGKIENLERLLIM